jgi:cell division septation protein DedD
MSCVLARFAAVLACLGLSAAWSGAARAAEVYVLQLASVKSEEAARGEWVRLQKGHPGLLGDMDLKLQSADLGDKGVFYRIRTGPFPNKATADDFCWQLRAENQDCLVLRR